MNDDTLTGQEPALGSEQEVQPVREVDRMTDVGQRIARLSLQLVAIGVGSMLTLEELAEFERYVDRQHTIAPILDPTGYRDLLYNGGFEELERRIRAIREVLRLCEELPKR